MRKIFLFNWIIILTLGFGIPLSAQNRAPDLSGIFDSTLNYTAGAGESRRHSFGIEEFVNLRLRVRPGDKAIFYSAINLIAISGNYVETAAMLGGLYSNPFFDSTPLYIGENYAAGIELERLYLRVNGDLFDGEVGLLRMNFGYGQVWGSSDFMNPRNPLAINARPRGLLGANLSFYPEDSLKLMAFVASPKNPFESGGGGFLPGLSLDKHWNKASLQALYSFQTPGGSDKGLHRFGVSAKADMELGFVLDALYTLNPDKTEGIDGLSLGAGFDYSLLKGDLYILAEYLFNGNASSSALGFEGNWRNNHYLYGSALYRFNDFSTLNLACVFCFDDLSFSPFATFTYELFQGFSLSLTARLPLDQDVLTGGKPGELGPIPPALDGNPGEGGAKLIVTAGARLRF